MYMAKSLPKIIPYYNFMSFCMMFSSHIIHYAILKSIIISTDLYIAVVSRM